MPPLYSQHINNQIEMKLQRSVTNHFHRHIITIGLPVYAYGHSYFGYLLELLGMKEAREGRTEKLQ